MHTVHTFWYHDGVKLLQITIMQYSVQKTEEYFSVIIHLDGISFQVYQYISALAPTPDVLGKLWDRVNSSSLLNRLVLPIYANIGFNLKHLTSIRVFETNYVLSMSSLAHILTFLPKVRELIIHEIVSHTLNISAHNEFS